MSILFILLLNVENEYRCVQIILQYVSKNMQHLHIYYPSINLSSYSLIDVQEKKRNQVWIVVLCDSS